MKKLLTLAAGAALIAAFGVSYAKVRLAAMDYGDSDKMITNDDISHSDMDQDKATVNQAPEGSGSEGSAAGGVSKEPDTMKSDKDMSKQPVDKGAAGKSEEGSGAGGPAKEPDSWSY